MMVSQAGRFGFDPFAEMRRAQQEMNRIFGDAAGRSAREFPPISLWIGEDSLVVTAEVPGVAEDDLELTVQEDTLTIRGERRRAAVDDKVSWHRRERGHGRFARIVELPFRVDAEKVDARLTNGVLEVELHRPEVDRPKKVQVKAA